MFPSEAARRLPRCRALFQFSNFISSYAAPMAVNIVKTCVRVNESTILLYFISQNDRYWKTRTCLTLAQL